MKKETKLDFWNRRAKEVPFNAGTDDFMLKELETKLLLDKVPKKSRVLDLGCGNGASLNMLVGEKECSGVGFDFSKEMLNIAMQESKNKRLESKTKYIQGSFLSIPDDIGSFDCIITQRALINLDSLKDQYEVFKKIKSLLKKDGLYIMIESFSDGLERINKLRRKLDIYDMEAPWHNTFFNEEDVKRWEDDEIKLKEMNYFASTYYYLSRVVYAKYADINNNKLEYDSDINKISLILPSEGNYGSVVAFIWQKK